MEPIMGPMEPGPCRPRADRTIHVWARSRSETWDPVGNPNAVGDSGPGTLSLAQDLVGDS